MSKKATPVIMKKEKSNTISVPAKTIMPKYNSFACGHGVYTDKSKVRANRKAQTRAAIKAAGY